MYSPSGFTHASNSVSSTALTVTAAAHQNFSGLSSARNR
jgi:hypothetical protein